MKSRVPVSRARPPARTRDSAGQVQVIAIGASAGGLDAFRRFFKAMPPHSGLAFVLIQHIDPNHISHMAEILSKYTLMRVMESGNRTRIEKNSVYIIPPNRNLSIRGDRLNLSLPDQRRGQRTPIDHFLLSVAEERGEKSVCILLSSTGTDGILGLRAIKAAGGLGMVQDPSTAEYGDLARAAIATGLVDYVLPVEQMPKTLLNYLSHSYIRGPRGVPVRTGEGEKTLAEIIKLLRTHTTHDFHYYKRGTLIRRIERKMGLHQIDKLPDFLKFLKKKPGEVVLLAKDLMIGVTSFFRDPQAFEELRTLVIKPLVRRHELQMPIRVWVPGCATGEEAYSIGMMLLDEIEESRKPVGVQIFATDIDEDALGYARNGHYPKSIAEDVDPKRLKRFFAATEDGYLVSKPLRECVVFAPQNLISSPPFSKVDLISCRNLAIYLEPEIQKKLTELFHFSLREGGFLFLGSSESIANRDDLFQSISKKWRIYRHLGGGRCDVGAIPIISMERAALPGVMKTAPKSPLQVLNELSRRLQAEHHDSANVLADRKGRILHLSGPTGKYLELPPGEPTLDLHTIAREGLRSRLRTAFETAIREERTVVLDQGSLKRDGGSQPVRVTIRPVTSPPAVDGLIHVVFEDGRGPSRVPGAPIPAPETGVPADGAVRQLESELQSTRDDLQNTIEELEASNEELKVANEEALSSNEELQSTNEELETSKEELQSLNEELKTVNNELQEKVQELAGNANDLSNLLSSSEIATVFLDTRFRVKRFTPQVTKLLNLIPGDIGRPIRHIVHNLVGVNMLEDAQVVLRKLIPIQRQVRSRKGASYVMRVLPYRTTENVIEGVVVTFSDVSELASREELLKDREMRQRVVADLGHRALAGLPLDRLMALAGGRVVDVLRADLSDVLKLDEAGRRLRVWAGVGWKKARRGKPEIAADGMSAPAVALRSRATAFVDAVPHPNGLKLTPHQRAERVASCVYTVMADSGGIRGLLGVHSKRKRAFTHEDGLFLQDVASVLASAISRDKTESELKAVRRFLEARVRERTRWLAASREVSRAANRADGLFEVMQRALMALCTGSGWRIGHVFLASAEKPWRPIFRCGWYPPGTGRYRSFRELTRETYLGGTGTMPSRVLRKGRPVWLYSGNPESPEDPVASVKKSKAQGMALSLTIEKLEPLRGRLAGRLGLRTAAAVPLKVGPDTVGVIEVFSEKSMPPSQPMLDMMEQVALEVGRSLERGQAQERISKALWREQQAIAQELHDSVGQELTGLGAMSESLSATLRRKGRFDSAKLKRLSLGLQATLEKIRNVTRGMIPLEIEPDDLPAALARLAKITQSRFDLPCSFRSAAKVRLPNREVATHLYRIAQESITNAVRHAGARRIHLTLKKGAREVRLIIRDDGRGLPKGRSSKDGVGLQILRHRANAIGAHLSVRSYVRGGTIVLCVLPQGGAARGPEFLPPTG
jgi:two-component system CheB/CheR fusion protein